MTPEQKKGSHGTCPVTRIVADNDQGFTEINTHDFDKSKHELFVEAEPEGEKKPEDMTKKELSAHLDTLGIQHNTKDKHEVLLALVPAAT